MKGKEERCRRSDPVVRRWRAASTLGVMIFVHLYDNRVNQNRRRDMDQKIEDAKICRIESAEVEVQRVGDLQYRPPVVVMREAECRWVDEIARNIRQVFDCRIANDAMPIVVMKPVGERISVGDCCGTCQGQ